MNPFSKASHFNTSGNPHAWNAPACSPKLSTALEKLISECLIDLVPNDKALVPSEYDRLGPDDWDGSFGLQKGMKTVKLGSGREIKADFVFIGIGNRSNVELVEQADDAALADGQIWVDDYLRVRMMGCIWDLADLNRYDHQTPSLGWPRITTPLEIAVPHQDGRRSKVLNMTQHNALLSKHLISFIADSSISIICDIKGLTLKPYKRTEAHGMVCPISRPSLR
jgi:hypothetical protein